MQQVAAEELVSLARECGADDAGVVALSRPELDDQREDICEAAPWARSLLSIVVRMNRDNLRTPARSVANLEFHHTGDAVNDTARRIVRALEARGVRAINPAMGFPMEMDRFPQKLWVVSHKPVAAAAGLGSMGIHRSIIHPRFGSFVLLGTIVMSAEVDEESQPIDFSPCVSCKLCVAVCPVGAIKSDGAFDFQSCYTHNYHEFMSGFAVLQEQAVLAKNVADYRRRVPQDESASWWQSLSFGANYKAAYCLAVCPAGEDVFAPFKASRREFVADVVRPLQAKEEKVFVVARGDAQAHVEKRFPHKTVRIVDNGLRPRTIDQLMQGMELSFQRGKAKGLSATYHFVFSGAEEREVTVRIREQALQVHEGRDGEADLTVRADTATWLGFLAGEKSLLWALLLRRIRIRGPLPLMKAFAACFP
ncbi:MAG: SCP2 sterol-binding domain-containing protein [Myxococcota bacterium]